jgi:hypothetical protein
MVGGNPVCSAISWLLIRVCTPVDTAHLHILMAKICLEPKYLGVLLVQRKMCYVIFLHTYSLNCLKCLKKHNLCLNTSIVKYRRTGLFQLSYSHQIYMFKQDE